MRRLRLFALLLLLLATPLFAADRWVLISGTTGPFHTDARVFNPSFEKDIQVTAKFAVAGNPPVDNAARIAASGAVFTVPKRSMHVLNDVTTALFATNSLGAIVFTSDDPFEVTSRIYAQTANGTLGQFGPGLNVGQARPKGAILQMKANGGAGQVGTFRTNIGVVNPVNADTTVQWRLYDRNNALVKEVLEKAMTSNAKPGWNERLIGDYYATCMDEAAIDRAGYDPVKPYLTRIDSIKTPEDVSRIVAYLHDQGFPAVFSFGVGVDLKDSNTVLINAGQGGLTLPNNEYYTKTDPKSVETRAKFVEYAANLFKLAGDDQATATAKAQKVLDLQTRLAKASLTPVERRNPDNNYNKIAYTAAEQLTPAFSWDAYFAERGVPNVAELNVAPAKFFTEFDAMVKDVSVDDWKYVATPARFDAAGKEIAAEVAIRYGAVFQSLFDFLVIAFVIFLVLRAYNRMRAPAPEAATPEDVLLLREIRDSLKSAPR